MSNIIHFPKKDSDRTNSFEQVLSENDLFKI